MKKVTFTQAVIAIGETIVFLTDFGIYEGVVEAYQLNQSHPDTINSLDLRMIDSYEVKTTSDGTMYLDAVDTIYAADFESLIDILEGMYYKDKKRPKESELNRDEDIARRTTYLCSDGKFYTITNYPQANNEGYTYQGVGNWFINQLDLDGYDLFVEAENTLFNHCGCEVCRIIEDDKGRFVIQDRMCEDSGFIFMDLKSAKLAAWWLMEEEVIEIGENLIDAAEQAAVGMKSVVDIMNNSVPIETDDDKLYRLINKPDWVYILQDEKCVIVNNEDNNTTVVRDYYTKEIIVKHDEALSINPFLFGLYGEYWTLKRDRSKADNFYYLFDKYNPTQEKLSECIFGSTFNSMLDALEYASNSLFPQRTEITTDPSANYQELFLCKSGDVFYMCAGSNGSFADYELWLYPKGSSTGAIFIHPDWRIIEEYIFKSQLLQAEYSINMDMIIDKNSGHRKRGDEYYIRNAKGQVVGSDKSYLGALNFARRIKREADEAAETKNNTRITFPSDDAVYILADGTVLKIAEVDNVIGINSKGTGYVSYLYQSDKPKMVYNAKFCDTIDELEKYFDNVHTIKYIIRSTDSETKEYKAFIGRTAETTGFVFTDKDTAVKSTLEVNMGIKEQQ